MDSNIAGRKLEAASLNLAVEQRKHAEMLVVVYHEQVGFERIVAATASLNVAQVAEDIANRRFVAALKEQYRGATNGR
jgi:hypothetical protein